MCVGVFVLGIAPGPPTYLICPLTLTANCDALAICTLGCGCELIVMGPSASISLVIGRWVRPRGAKSPVPAFRRCLSPRLLVTAVITFTHHIRHHLLLALPIQTIVIQGVADLGFLIIAGYQIGFEHLPSATCPKTNPKDKFSIDA